MSALSEPPGEDLIINVASARSVDKPSEDSHMVFHA